ncbi:hypothetical protein FQ087_09750 [Sporosarcina sp. ANT_H38]|uniref:hypothetical protein n=1 Tax=Sporosarcina sp. ANT_H38 TaxID=2597358 RepID=UPI0011F2017B|nr:hypothetical protein [Sporosarcina sp. ANT_H38]KAA0966490.1 hypothetical protein FQ087_09750 [Sporosarcina sp. ANT_H38]
MTTIFLVFLFIIQIISFYFLALLYTKITKFDDLEKKQRKLMTEMDNSIAVYLSELKDENERLIEQLTVYVQQPAIQKSSAKNTLASEESVATEESSPVKNTNIPKMPVHLALKSYKAVAASLGQTSEETVVPEEAEDVRTQVTRLHDAGQSIEEIAKQLGKGRTEIELILKFR